MKLEHIAMYVTDLEKMKDFFVTYFGAVPNRLYHNNLTGFRSYFLTFSDGARLELMTRPNLEDPEKGLNRTGFVHLALATGSREAVDALTRRLRNDGYTVLSGPRTTGDGYYESCILGPENNQIEITV